MTERAPNLQETPARQGQTGAGVRWVLRVSLALVVIAFVVIFAVFAHRGSSHGAQETVAQQVTTTTPNTVKEAAATAAPGSVPAQAAGRKEQTTGG